ncbi:hypothetical protein [Streptomyces anulatus]|uniref:hypothetical protein n=1 Tax=Streptomyces anulatus TaxID=1892 RepID=UPI003636FBFC
MADAQAKGPVKVQLPGTAESSVVPAPEVKPEEVATLVLTYVDGRPVITPSGGPALPASLTIVDESGQPVAAYTAAPLATARTLNSGDVFILDAGKVVIQWNGSKAGILEK